MAFKQEVNVPVVVTIGVISGILILVAVIGTQAWFQSEEEQEMAYRVVEADNRPAADNWLKNLQETQKAAINGPVHWADKKGGKVAIPVSDAMDYLSKNGEALPSAQPASNNP